MRRFVCDGSGCGLGVRLARGCPGIGVIGTFSNIASSGTSSSKSSYSASSSFTVFFPGCHDGRRAKDPLRFVVLLVGVMSLADLGALCMPFDRKPLLGDGDRDDVLARVCMKNDGEDGLEKPLRMPRPIGKFAEPPLAGI